MEIRLNCFGHICTQKPLNESSKCMRECAHAHTILQAHICRKDQIESEQKPGHIIKSRGQYSTCACAAPVHDHLQSVRHLAEIDAGKQHDVHRADALPRGERVHVQLVDLQHERDLQVVTVDGQKSNVA